MAPLISIITVSMNSLRALELTNASLAVVEGRPVETILVDGLSVDGTKEFMAGPECRYTVKIREGDSGIYDAMNKGVLAANGQYLLFLNCGDRLLKGLSWSVLSTALQGAPAVRMGNLVLDTGGRVDVRDAHFRVETFVRHAWPHQAAFIPRSFFTELGCYDEEFRISADQEWFVRALVAGRPFRALGFDVACYAGGGVSERMDNRSAIKNERKAILVRHLGRKRAFWLSTQVHLREFLLSLRKAAGRGVRRVLGPPRDPGAPNFPFS